MEYVINPDTERKIKVGGPTYLKLIKEGKLHPVAPVEEQPEKEGIEPSKTTPRKRSPKVTPPKLELPELLPTRAFVAEDRTLDLSSARKLTYNQQLADVHKPRVLHWGQRKLLLSEIEFLTLHGGETSGPATTVVYVGAANGQHIPLLLEMFPNHDFVLYDPAPFHPETVNWSKRFSKSLKIVRDYFIDDTAKKYRGQNVLYICDIRRAPSNMKETDPGYEREFSKLVKEDMELQRRWYYLMQPRATMLKFRPPYVDPNDKIGGETTYLTGTIYLQAWAPPSSTETRLIIVGPNAKERIYPDRGYEQLMFYFNLVLRPSKYSLPEELKPLAKKYAKLFGDLWLDYDVSTELFILSEYAKSRRSGEAIDGVIDEIEGKITKWLGKSVDRKQKEYLGRLNEREGE